MVIAESLPLASSLSRKLHTQVRRVRQPSVQSTGRLVPGTYRGDLEDCTVECRLPSRDAASRRTSTIHHAALKPFTRSNLQQFAIAVSFPRITKNNRRCVPKEIYTPWPLLSRCPPQPPPLLLARPSLARDRTFFARARV